MQARMLKALKTVCLIAFMVVTPAVAGCASSRGGGCGSGGCGGGGCGSCGGNRGAPSAVSQQERDYSVPSRSSTPAPATAAYGGQKTCPVTDEALGSMGKPIPVTVKGETIYVCCRGCTKKVQADPDQYLAKVRAERGTQ